MYCTSLEFTRKFPSVSSGYQQLFFFFFLSLVQFQQHTQCSLTSCRRGQKLHLPGTTLWESYPNLGKDTAWCQVTRTILLALLCLQGKSGLPGMVEKQSKETDIWSLCFQCSLQKHWSLGSKSSLPNLISSRRIRNLGHSLPSTRQRGMRPL